MIAEKDFAGRQARGKRRRQEDAYAFSDISGNGDNVEGLFVVVADGMGGHTSGEQASGLALENFVDSFHLAEGPIAIRFQSALMNANVAIANEMNDSPDLEGMGTTLVAVAVTPHGIEWISVGDSPLYLWRSGSLTRLNEDHSFRPMLDELVESGALNPDVAARHPLKNILRAAITGREIDLTDQSAEPLELLENDILVVATDGLQTLSDEEICDTVSKSAAEDASAIAANLLNDIAKIGYAKQDNITVAIIKAVKGGFIAHPRQPEKSPIKKNAKTVIMNPLLEQD